MPAGYPVDWPELDPLAVSVTVDSDALLLAPPLDDVGVWDVLVAGEVASSVGVGSVGPGVAELVVASPPGAEALSVGVASSATGAPVTAEPRRVPLLSCGGATA